MQNTIAAIATPPGDGGVAIIRISGPHAFDIASKVFSKDVHCIQSHTICFGQFLDSSGTTIDEGLILVMRAPKSFTGEHVVELQCHGSSLIAKHLLNAVLHAGARMAEPGEFTKRAFLNGKMDLAQAEAVQSLIAAKNKLAMQAAEKHLEGQLSGLIRNFQKKLTDIAAIIEAWIDFPEEGLEFASLEEIVQQLQSLLHELHALKNTFYQGRVISEGISLCLAGLPNAGKSSLMNALLGAERAIVTPIAGTTRDVLEEDLRLGSLHFRLIDTAGLRDTDEIIEQEGIRRTKVSMQSADIILYVIDATKGLQEEDLEILKGPFKDKILRVWNKCDLPNNAPQDLQISALHKEGLEPLTKAIEAMIWKDGFPCKDEIVLTHARHYDALDKAICALEHLVEGLQKEVSPEFLTSDIREALKELSKIIGSDITEEILNAIFSKFCVGK